MRMYIKHYTTDWNDVLTAIKTGHLLSLRLWWCWKQMRWGFVYEYTYSIPEIGLGLSLFSQEYFASMQNSIKSLGDSLGLSANQPQKNYFDSRQRLR